MCVTWFVFWHVLHDALIEDALDKAAREALPDQIHHPPTWNAYGRFLRWACAMATVRGGAGNWTAGHWTPPGASQRAPSHLVAEDRVTGPAASRLSASELAPAVHRISAAGEPNWLATLVRSCLNCLVAKGADTRRAILDDAVQVASKVGLNGLTIGQLAAHTGMSKSGLFAHFQSKEALQLGVLERTREWFVTAVMAPALAAPRGEPRLRVLYERWRDWIGEAFEGGCVLVAAASELDDTPGRAHDSLVRMEIDLREAIVTIAAGAVGEGHFRSDLDVEQLAFELNGIMLAHHHASRLMRDSRARERADQAFEALLARAVT